MSCSDRSTEISHDISDMRKPYVGDENPLLENDLPSRDPFEFFDKWFKVMLKTPGIGEPNAMAVATADKFGVPSLRMVLLKKYDKTGFCFFTNYESKKGKELDENPNAALLFYWDPLSRQVRIDGKVEKISDAESEDYFNRRPKKSQISATVSPQSQPVTLKSLEYKYDELMEKYDDVSVPRPKFWDENACSKTENRPRSV